MAYILYDRVVQSLSKKPGERTSEDFTLLEPLFRKKSRLFEKLHLDILNDVITHCQFETRRKNEFVTKQGEHGESFYIILRGKVTVYVKEGLDDGLTVAAMDREASDDRAKLGTFICELSDGDTFGEVALLNDDCVRSATVVTEQMVDLIIINRNLYNRCLAKVVKADYQEKLAYIDSNPLFNTWSTKWKKAIAMSMQQIYIPYEEAVFRQGQSADKLYFIMSGEVKLVIDPDAHQQQFLSYMEECNDMMEEISEEANMTARTDLTKLSLPSKEELHDVSSARILNLSPSAVRRHTHHLKHHPNRINFCLITAGQTIGDTEFILDMTNYYCSAICSHETRLLILHRAHFVRFFRRKNPQSLRQLQHSGCQHLELRSTYKTLKDKLPLVQCMIFRLKVLDGHFAQTKNSPDELDRFSDRPYSQATSLARSTITSRSFPLMNNRKFSPRKQHNRANYTKSAAFPDINRAFLPDASDPRRLQRDGIFVKLTQISNPGSRKVLSVDDDEFTYLTQLKRRIGRTLNDYNPYTHLDTTGVDTEGQGVARLCRKGHPRKRTSTLPALKGSRAKNGVSQSAAAKNRGVLFKLPNF